MSGWGIYGFSTSAFQLARTGPEKLRTILKNLESSARGLRAAADSGGWSEQDASRLRDAAQRIQQAAAQVDANAIQLPNDTLRDLHEATVSAVQSLHDQANARDAYASFYITDRVLEAYGAIQRRDSARAIGMLRAAQPRTEDA